MENTEHILLVGKGGLKFAKNNGIKEIDESELLVDREIEFLNKIKKDKSFKSKTSFIPKDFKMGVYKINI
jgi:isoaspartyl peptidase/L-asparaginase-like protein (Ntn-hydrolase superfamily)